MLAYLLLALLSLLPRNPLPTGTKHAFSLMAPYGFLMTGGRAGGRQTGLSLANVMDALATLVGVSFFDFIAMLCTGRPALLCRRLVPVDKVLPSKFGVAQHPLFSLQASYWRCCGSLAVSGVIPCECVR